MPLDFESRVKIQKMDNGWVMHEDFGTAHRGTVFEYQDSLSEEESRKSECEAFQRMISTLIDLMGPTYNGFSAHNVRVEIFKGDEIEGPTSDEPE